MTKLTENPGQTHYEGCEREPGHHQCALCKLTVAEAALVRCEHCGFGYSAEHSKADGSYSCPLCELVAAEAALAADETIFRWLLGEEGEFPESAPRKRYGFRSELRRRLAARAPLP